MKMTLNDFDTALTQFAMQKIIPGVQDSTVLFGIGFAKNMLLNKAHAFLAAGGFADETGNIDVDMLASAIRDGFSMTKTLSLAKMHIPADLEQSDGEDFIKNYLNYTK